MTAAKGASGADGDGAARPSVGGRWWAWTALLVFAVLFGLAVYADADRLVDALAAFRPGFLLAVVGLTLAAYALRFAKWELYLHVLDVRLGTGTSLAVFLSGLMGALTPAKVGEAWKAWLARRAAGVDVARTLPAIAAERVTDLVALAGLALLGVSAYGASTGVLVAVFATFALGVLAIRSRRLAGAVLDRVEGWPLVGRFADELATVHEGSFELFAPGPMVGALALSVLAWGLEGVALWAVLAGFGVQTGPSLPVAAFGLGSVLGALSFLPGGLGAAEGGMVGVLVTGGVARPAAAGATLVVRAGTLWFGALLGAAVFAASADAFRRERGSREAALARNRNP